MKFKPPDRWIRRNVQPSVSELEVGQVVHFVHYNDIGKPDPRLVLAEVVRISNPMVTLVLLEDYTWDSISSGYITESKGEEWQVNFKRIRV